MNLSNNQMYQELLVRLRYDATTMTSAATNFTRFGYFYGHRILAFVAKSVVRPRAAFCFIFSVEKFTFSRLVFLCVIDLCKFSVDKKHYLKQQVIV